MPELLLALDQGTTSSRAIVFTPEGDVRGFGQHEHPQFFPAEGWVEHDPEAIWDSQMAAAREALDRAEVTAKDIAALGITNQRETVILWERSTGRPIAPAIVWQDRRTSERCRMLQETGLEAMIQQRTGLVLDPYFSATKLQWLLDNVPGARTRAEKGELAFGTVDTFLLWRLTGGRVYATDVTNASRTMLMDANRCDWDDELLDLFHVPREVLPEIRPSAWSFGVADRHLLGAEIPIAAIAGDQQAAAFGQACFAPGMVKNTYGTGSFLLMNVGERRMGSEARLLSTVAWQIGQEKPVYALEGSIFVTGAAIQWLRDGLGIIGSANESEALAASVSDTTGVTFVPAFVGLGAPHWRPDVRGAVLGLTRGVTKAHIARAALEAACFQTVDVLDAMAEDAGGPIQVLRADGGMTANELVMQMQADLAGVPVHCPAMTETTALGAAWLAGLGAGIFRNAQELAGLWKAGRQYEPRMSADEREANLRRWRTAVRQVCGEAV